MSKKIPSIMFALLLNLVFVANQNSLHAAAALSKDPGIFSDAAPSARGVLVSGFRNALERIESASGCILPRTLNEYFSMMESMGTVEERVEMGERALPVILKGLNRELSEHLDDFSEVLDDYIRASIYIDRYTYHNEWSSLYKKGNSFYREMMIRLADTIYKTFHTSGTSTCAAASGAGTFAAASRRIAPQTILSCMKIVDIPNLSLWPELRKLEYDTKQLWRDLTTLFRASTADVSPKAVNAFVEIAQCEILNGNSLRSEIAEWAIEAMTLQMSSALMEGTDDTLRASIKYMCGSSGALLIFGDTLARSVMDTVFSKDAKAVHIDAKILKQYSKIAKLRPTPLRSRILGPLVLRSFAHDLETGSVPRAPKTVERYFEIRKLMDLNNEMSEIAKPIVLSVFGEEAAASDLTSSTTASSVLPLTASQKLQLLFFLDRGSVTSSELNPIICNNIKKVMVEDYTEFLRLMKEGRPIYENRQLNHSYFPLWLDDLLAGYGMDKCSEEKRRIFDMTFPRHK